MPRRRPPAQPLSQPRQQRPQPADLDPLTVPGFEGRPAIAVLPFDNLSGDPEQEYFADGIAEDLITRLSAWRDFPVIARNSSFTYKGKAVDVKQVSRELGVRYVVEGSVRKAGDRVRISAQLIDATTGGHVWAETYDRELQDIFALQDEITEAIVASMHPELQQAEGERAAQKEPQDLDAWDCVQRAGWHRARSTAADTAKARELYRRAIDQDPHSVRAFAGLATTHRLDLFFQWTDSPEVSVNEMTRAAERAVALDARDPYAQAALGLAYAVTGPPEKAVAAYELAVQLNPSLAFERAQLGAALAATGKLERGIAEVKKAIRLNPKDPMIWAHFFLMAFACFAAQRYENAIDWAGRSLQHKPDWPGSYRMLAASYAHLGQLEEAHGALEESLRLHPDYSFSTWQRTSTSVDPAVVERLRDGLRKAGLPE